MFSPLNNLPGKNLLPLSQSPQWSSTEYFSNSGRYTNTDGRGNAVVVSDLGDLLFGYKPLSNYFRCVWRP
jgi:hypothetical protein